MISLSLGAGLLCDDFAAELDVAFFLAAALIGKTPAERPLLDIVVDVSVMSKRTMRQ
jgi:hypothetical protein